MTLTVTHQGISLRDTTSDLPISEAEPEDLMESLSDSWDLFNCPEILNELLKRAYLRGYITAPTEVTPNGL